MKLKFTIFEKIKMLKSTFKNLKFLTKCKSGFPKISAMSFSSMKIKEFSKNLLKFSRPSTNLNLSIRNYHQNGRSWSDYIDDLFDSDFDVPSFTGPTILGTGLGLGYGVYNIVEYSQPLSENLPMSVGVMVATTLFLWLLMNFWHITWRLGLIILSMGIFLYIIQLMH